MSYLNLSKENQKFILLSFGLALFIIFIAAYLTNLLDVGKHSYKQYDILKEQKARLQYDIRKLQFENATLQKQYLELKNLEPEEL